MDTQSLPLTNLAEPRRHDASFRRIFMHYILGLLATMIGVTGIIEGIGFVGILLHDHGKSPMFPDPPTQIIGLLLVTVVPLAVGITTILIFSWRMGRAISHPLQELMGAVEKIRQHDLDFTITYRAKNELGDLCEAISALRGELQASLEREWRKQEEMRLHIAALSHDLRTPVTIIQGYIEGLARVEQGAKRQQRLDRYLPVLEANSQRMTRLLNEMLLVATLEEPGFMAHPETVCLEEVFMHKTHIYQLHASAQDIAFSYQHLSSSVPQSTVGLDWHHLEQILDNLMENALRNTPKHGQIILTVTEDEQVLSLVLRDTGYGIAAQDLPYVFAKFYRGKARSHETQRTNSGLGLYICKLLAEALGGTITIENHPSGGCKVAVTVPLQRNEIPPALSPTSTR